VPVGHVGVNGIANKMVVWKPEEERSFGRPWHAWWNVIENGY
jgi:hypothetical protein